MLASFQPPIGALPRLKPRLKTLLVAMVAGVVVYGVVAPLLAIVHELIVLGMANLINDLDGLAAADGLLRSLPLDPIYTGALLSTLGGIEPRGLALAGPLGEALHAGWPALFEAPALVAAGSWASAVVAPGATVVSRWICGLSADAALVGLGLLAVRLSKPNHPWLAIVGAIIQAHVVATHLVDVPPELADVEAAGIPFAVTMVTSGDVQGGPRLSESLAALPEAVRDATLGLGMATLAYLPAGLLAVGWRVTRTRSAPSIGPGQASRSTGSSPPTRRGWSNNLGLLLIGARLGRLMALAAFGLAVALSPLGDLADAQTHFLVASFEGEVPGIDPSLSGLPLPVPPPMDGAAADASPTALPATSGAGASATVASLASAPPPVSSDGPAVVAVTGSQYQFQYTVNGVPRVIRGIGYNVQYRQLPDDERARRLDADFTRLQAAGVTTVFGWAPAEFDGVLLDAAQRHNLGVAPPFDLDPDADYANPAVKAQITHDVLAWVQMYRDHPAVRMWAIGNEVLHKLVYPSWMPMRSDPAWEQRARSFAQFYVELIDQVHALDPNHPIIHRDAEDAYLTWLRDAMAGSGRRPWFIYGVNAYTPRLAEILNSWPSEGWDVPLFVSEFAPGGMSPADRPDGFRAMWRMIRADNSWVLGGAVYAWTTDGPEEVDRVFGLVDADGKPVDGAFAAVSGFYRGVAHQFETERTSPSQTYDEFVWAFARRAIVTVQNGQASSLLPSPVDTPIMGDIGSVSRDAVSDNDLDIQRVRDPRRIAWGRDAGLSGEWWVTWRPPDQPRRKLTFVVQERDGGALGVRYIYFGPR